jgi:hypothetical protein
MRFYNFNYVICVSYIYVDMCVSTSIKEGKVVLVQAI